MAKITPNPTRGKPISVYISDLFFNLDHDDAAIRSKHGSRGNGWHREKLADEAKWFLNCLDALGVEDLPEAYDVIEDFLGRQ